MTRRPEPRGRASTEILYGVHPVAEALEAGRRRLVRLWVRRGRRGRPIAALRSRAESLGVPVEEVEEQELQRRVPGNANTQGVLLEVGPLPALSLEELLARIDGPGRRAATTAGRAGPAGSAGAPPTSAGGPEAEADEQEGRAPGLLVALDEVQDPQNVGAVARAAESAGALGLLVAERRAAPLSPAVSRASAGALEILPVARAGNLGRALDALRGQGWWVLGADPEASASLYELPDAAFAGRVCLVLGAEGRGLRPGVRRRVDHLLRVPMAGRLASLNVAATAAVVCFEWRRRTRPPGSSRERSAPRG